jgi:hypothetical protein
VPAGALSERAWIELVDIDEREEQRGVDPHQRHRPLEEQLARDREQLWTFDISDHQPAVQRHGSQRVPPHVAPIVLRE